MGEVMNLARRLYELQQVDLEIQNYRETLAQLNFQIGKSDVVLEAKADLDTMKKHLAEVNQKRRDMEWEAEDLRKDISKLNEKLYGGNTGRYGQRFRGHLGRAAGGRPRGLFGLSVEPNVGIDCVFWSGHSGAHR